MEPEPDWELMKIDFAKQAKETGASPIEIARRARHKELPPGIVPWSVDAPEKS